MKWQKWPLSSFRIAFASWTVVATLLAGQYFIWDRQHKNYLPFFHYVFWPGLNFYSWALLTPFIFAVYRLHPFTQAHAVKRIFQYIAAIAVFTVIQATLNGIGGWLYKPELPPLQSVLHLLDKEWFDGVQICFIEFGIAAYQEARKEARFRQIREAELEARVASAELEMLRIQLHPHFLFNTLQAATVLVHEDPKAAEDVLLRLSELLRVALDDMRNQEVPLTQELAFLDLYVGIQKQRFRDRLRVHILAAPQVLHSKVPSLILQPLVENAVHHGIGKHKETDVIEVLADAKNGFIELEVKNFSSSLDDRKENNGHGVGLRNIRARLEQLYGEDATLELRPILPKGVSAFIRIPLEAAGEPSAL